MAAPSEGLSHPAWPATAFRAPAACISLPRPLRWERGEREPRRPFQLCSSPLAVLSFPLLIALHVGGEAQDESDVFRWVGKKEGEA